MSGKAWDRLLAHFAMDAKIKDVAVPKQARDDKPKPRIVQSTRTSTRSKPRIKTRH